MKPAAKRNADKSDPGTSKSPEPKRPNTEEDSGERSMEERRRDQERRLKEFKENKTKKIAEQKKARPAWRPAGNGPRPVTRSMTKQKSANNLQSTPNRKQTQPEKKKNTSLPLPKEGSSANGSTVDVIPEEDTFTPIKPMPRPVMKEPVPMTVSITPVANRLQRIDIEHENNYDEFNLMHWQRVYDDHHARLINVEAEFKLMTSTDDEFWQVERDRAFGEVTFFLGKKSKFTQFNDMLKNPKGEKFKVKSEDDISCFWDGMVLPSVEDFMGRAKWLVSSAKADWAESEKGQKPTQKIGKSPARPKKENKKPRTASDPEKNAEREAKKLKAKKDADDRRRKMKQMMAEKKRAMSASALPNNIL